MARQHVQFEQVQVLPCDVPRCTKLVGSRHGSCFLVSNLTCSGFQRVVTHHDPVTCIFPQIDPQHSWVGHEFPSQRCKNDPNVKAPEQKYFRFPHSPGFTRDLGLRLVRPVDINVIHLKDPPSNLGIVQMVGFQLVLFASNNILMF